MKKEQPRVIAFVGPAGCGKSTASRILRDKHGYTTFKFARPLKRMLITLFEEAGIPDDVIHEMIEGSLKEQPCEALGGKSPRYAMQSLGTDWGRNLFCYDIWVNIAEMKARTILDSGGKVAIEDLRFDNESQMVMRLGGKVIKILPPESHIQIDSSGHVSETNELAYNIEIKNHGTKIDLENEVDRCIQTFCR